MYTIASTIPNFLDNLNLLKYKHVKRMQATTIKARIVYSIEPESIFRKDEDLAPIRIVLRNHGIPSERRMFMVLAPSELDTPIPPSPFLDMMANEMDSGRQPPAARNVRPRTASGIPKMWPEK